MGLLDETRHDVDTLPPDRRMGLVEDITRMVAGLPPNAFKMAHRDFLTLVHISRRLEEGLQEARDALARSVHVDERSRPIEKEWYKAALAKADEHNAAWAVFDDWWGASHIEIANKEATALHLALRKSVAQLNKAARKIGDPTAPDWRPPLGDRLAAKLRAREHGRS